MGLARHSTKSVSQFKGDINIELLKRIKKERN